MFPFNTVQGKGILLAWLFISGMMLLGCSTFEKNAMSQVKNSQTESSVPAWWSPELRLNSLSEIDERLDEPFDDGPYEVTRYQAEKESLTGKPAGVARMTNCASYLSLIKKGFVPAGSEWTVLLERGASCNTLAALKVHRPANVSYLKTFRLDQSAPEILQPQCAAIISNDDMKSVAAAEGKGLSWKQYEPDQRANIEAGKLVVEGDGWKIKLELYARGDFDGDGIEDIILKKQSIMTEGTYHNIGLLILTRYREGEILKVIREIPY